MIDLSLVTVMMSRVINLNKVNSFQKFFDNVWDYIDHLGFYHRVDIVIDNYVDENLLKGQTRHSRDLGIIIKFTLTDKLPTNFKKDFLLSGSNKRDLYDMMVEYFARDKVTYVTTTKYVITK